MQFKWSCRHVHSYRPEIWWFYYLASCWLYECPSFNPLNAELNPICHLPALLGTHHILHVSRIRVKLISIPTHGMKLGEVNCSKKVQYCTKHWIVWGHAVAQLVEALRYKLVGLGFDSRWCHWNFSLTLPFRPHCGPGVDSASNRNEYQEYFLGDKGGRCIGLTTLPLSGADCLEIWKPQPPGTFWDLSRPVMGLLYLYWIVWLYDTRWHCLQDIRPLSFPMM